MKIEAFFICWNEARILPWVLEYYKAAGVDKITVIDNCSDDNSMDILSNCDIPITVIPYTTDGRQNECALSSIKNSCWKNSDADWVWVADCDEVPYVPMGLKAYLEGRTEAVITPDYFELVSWHLPEKRDGLLLHQYSEIRLAHRPYGLKYNAKSPLFRPSALAEINYNLGAHGCNPADAKGRKIAVTPVNDLAMFHLKKLGEEYLLDRNAIQYNRLPEEYKINKSLDFHYLLGTDVNFVRGELERLWNNGVEYTQIQYLK